MGDKSDILSDIFKKFRCKICNKDYASNSSLWNHNKKFHPPKTTILQPKTTILQPKTTILPPKIIQCNYCKKYFQEMIV